MKSVQLYKTVNAIRLPRSNHNCGTHKTHLEAGGTLYGVMSLFVLLTAALLVLLEFNAGHNNTVLLLLSSTIHNWSCIIY